MSIGFYEHQQAIPVEDIKRTRDGSSRPSRLFLPQVHDFIKTDSLSLGPSRAVEELFIYGRPRFLCRPSGEGKTTELNFICQLFEGSGLEDKRIVRVELSEDWRQKSRADLFGALLAHSGVKRARDLIGLLEALPTRNTLITIDNVENLSEDALLWLVSSVVAYAEQTARFGVRQRAYIAVAGSLSLEFAGKQLNSIYFTKETHRVRDYSRLEVRSLCEDFSLRSSMEVYPTIDSSIHGFTNGEKRLTNLILDLLDSHFSESISEENLVSAVRRYRSLLFRKDLRLVTGLRAVAQSREARMAIRMIFAREHTRRSVIRPAAFCSLLNFGFIALQGDEVRVRNALLGDILTDCVGRERRAFSFLRDCLPRDTLVAHRERLARRRLAKTLEETAFTGFITWMNYCEVLEVEEGVATLRVSTDDSQEFIVQLEIKDLGRPVSPAQGFIKYAMIEEGQLSERYFFYGDRGSRSSCLGRWE